MELIENYYIPVFIKIFDSDALVAELKIENVKINREISKKEFEL